VAKLIFNFGPMNSRKSLDLLATAYNFEEKDIPFLALKSSLDTRDEGVIKSRAGLERKCTLVTPEINIYEVVKQYNNILIVQGDKPLKWILVDECQFLTEDQVDQLSDIVDYLDITVMCYGLRTDFKSHLFPASKRLFEIADTIEEIKSSCECGKKAMINARFDSEGNILTEGSQILVGGDDIYKPLCRKCWKDKIRKKNS
jgi:thymidine kinase